MRRLATVLLMASASRSPRNGDLVRANQWAADAPPVLGTLEIRPVSSGKLHVFVVFDDGRCVSVDPASVSLDREFPQATPSRTNDLADDDSGSSDVVELAEAIKGGLVETISRKELTWDDLLARMRLLLSPLVAAGWTLSDEEVDHSGDGHDCVVAKLTRDDEQLAIDHFPDGWTFFWDGADDGTSDEITPAIQTFGSTVEATARNEGWI